MKKHLLSTLFLCATLGASAQPVCNGNMVTFQYKNDSARQVMVDVQFAGRKEIRYFSHLAGYDEVAGNDYNLSVSTYVEAEDTREKVDIVKLNAEIRKIVEREQVLRDEIDKIIAEIEGRKNG